LTMMLMVDISGSFVSKKQFKKENCYWDCRTMAFRQHRIMTK
jgi:hypothetical protein